jgi:trans-aconitate methyltransferase
VSEELRMYSRLSSWWHLLSAPEDYEEEAAFYRRQIVDQARGPVRRVLELGSGGGNNASHLKVHFEMTLIDRSEDMLAQSRRLNPECEHLVGDMRDVRLRREFDAVFVHDAVSYITSEDDLRRVIETASVHCRRGGAVVFCPDYVRETLHPRTSHGGHDGDDGRAMRYIEWVTDPDPADSLYVVDYAFLLRGSDGAVHVEHERHVEGAFPIKVWLRVLEDAGFEASTVQLELAEEQAGWQIFVGVKR